MADLTKIFGGALTVSNISISPTAQLFKAMVDTDITPPSEILLDGEIHRFGDKNNNWYVAYGDGIPAGIFGNWKTGDQYTWRADVGHKLSISEEVAHRKRIDELKTLRKAKLDKKHEDTAQAVYAIFNNLPVATKKSAYLKRKQVEPHNLRQSGNSLVAPIYNSVGVLTSLQYITPNGEKRFQAGGEIKGCYNILGNITADTKKIFIAEGFATAASIYETTSVPTVITYSAGNIPPVTELFRTRYGTISIIIVADNDESKAGITYAEKAAKEYGAQIIIPPEIGDANDYKVGGNNLHDLLVPPNKWLVSVKDFTAEPHPIKWLIKNWVQDESLIMMFGQSGCGKTFVSVDMALRIATPSIKTWHGEIVKHGDVAYLAGEGHAGLRARCKAWIQHNEQVPGDIRFFISQSGTDLNTAEGLNKTILCLRDMEITPRLIVVDTLHRFLNGDENSAQDSKTMLDACSLLTHEFNCSVMLVHHTGVSSDAQKRGRGSSAWKGALEQEICVEKEAKEPFIKMTQTKNKDSEPAAPKTLELATITLDGWLDEDGEQVNSAIVMPTENRVEKKKNSKLSEFVKLFEKAWFASGAEIENKAPYITKAALKNKLISDGFGADRTVDNHLNSSYDNKFISTLIKEKCIEPCLNGWIFIEPEQASIMMLSRGK